jgi:hypothetical protein
LPGCSFNSMLSVANLGAPLHRPQAQMSREGKKIGEDVRCPERLSDGDPSSNAPMRWG